MCSVWRWFHFAGIAQTSAWVTECEMQRERDQAVASRWDRAWPVGYREKARTGEEKEAAMAVPGAVASGAP